MPETITSIKKENDALKRQIEILQKDFSKLQTMIESKELPKQDGVSKEAQAQLHSFQTSLEFVSNEYDTLNAFQTEAKNELKKLNSRLTEIATKVNDVGDALEQMHQYSYQYNIKIVGLSQQDERESAYQTTTLCVNLFQSLGADVVFNDIDIAHRVRSRREDGKPNPIICKFVRRNSKESVMKQRREINKVNPSVRIFDHLTPKNQQILFEANGFKAKNGYQYCWTKNSAVYLRKDANSRAIRINQLHDLLKLQNSRDVSSR